MLFVLLLVITLTGDSLLIIYSPKNYVCNMVFAILLTVAFCFYTIFFFTVINPVIGNYYKFFLSCVSEEEQIDYVVVKNVSKQLVEYNGLELYQVEVEYQPDSYRLYTKIMFSFSSDIKVSDKRRKVAIHGPVILKIED